MVDHLVGTQVESHENKAGQAEMFSFDNASPEKSCRIINLVHFVSLPARFCVLECQQKRVKSSTAEKVFFLWLLCSPLRGNQTDMADHLVGSKVVSHENEAGQA